MKLILSSLIFSSLAILFYNSAFLTSQVVDLIQQTPLTTRFSPLQTRSSLLTTNPLIRIFSTPPSLFASPESVNMSVPRAIRQAFLAIEQSEGAGARVRRSIGTAKLRHFSPFLMLDHFTISLGAGFPDHPHRGQETITYLLKGAVDHEDFAGNAGTIEAGDLQFMTAGRGIMHAEMPRQNKDGSANVGMQLWVDLPEKLKSCEPRYHDLKAKEIPTVHVDDGKVTIKIISGQSHGTDSVQELAYTPLWIFDIILKPGGKVTQPLPTGWNAFAYTLAGSTTFGVGTDQTAMGQYYNVVFEQKGDSVSARVPESAKEDGRFCKPFNTPTFTLKSH